MAEILREIDEELRQDQLKVIWRKHGTAIVAVVLAVVIAIGGFQGWKYWEAKKRQEDATAYAIALDIAAEGDANGAVNQLTTSAEDASDGYKLLMHFQAAALKAEEGDAEGAIADYEKIAATAGIDDVYRDLATVLLIMRRAETGNTEGLLDRLAPLAEDGRPFRYTAREVAASIALEAGKLDEARAHLTRITDDLTAPQGARGRAAEILAAIGG
ncbi:MAG: tetratricopeptide repeat protein [Alphaproteobacteria bacterium]